MRIGFHLTPFWSPTDRAPTAIIDEAIEVVRAAAGMGFAWVSIGHHWVSHPTVWPHPIAMLGRLAPEAGAMRLKTSMLLLPLLNPVDVAESVVTEVTFEGAYMKLTKARLGLPPHQRPHPPLEMGAQSVGATRRAARLVDAVFFGPQVAWADVGRLVGVYREARAAESAGTAGTAFASRSLIVGASKEAARAAARGYLERTFAMYRSWEMQEPGMVQLQLGFDSSLDDWTINGNPAQCLATIARARALGLDGIGLTIYSLPREVKARIEYLRMISEEIVRPATALGL